MTPIGAHTESALLATDRHVDHPGLAAAVVLVASLGYAFGGLGLAVGLASAATWALLGTPYAIAVGHVLLATLIQPTLTLETLAVIEAGFVALVLAPLHRAPSTPRFAAAVLATITLVGAIAYLAATTHSLWLAGALALLATAAIAYAGHRLTHVRLGKVTHGGSP